MPSRLALLAAAPLLGLLACTSGTPPSAASSRAALEGARLVAIAPPPRPESHERVLMRLLLETASESVEVAPAAFDGVQGPRGQVAFIGPDGLWLWAAGQSRFVARASAHGLAANDSGVLFATAAERGGGAGLAFATWSGALTTLIPAPEDLPGPAGYHHPALSPDGAWALAFSDLTPRPSLWRVRLDTREVSQLGGEIPSRAELPGWVEGRLSWTDGDGRQVVVEPHSGRVEVRP